MAVDGSQFQIDNPQGGGNGPTQPNQTPPDSGGLLNQQPTDVQLKEAGAQQLLSMSLIHMNQLINPQLATETLASGATNDVSQAMQNPELQPYMTAGPTTSGQQAPQYMMNGPGQPGANLQSFDWNTYWKFTPFMLSDDKNKSWQQFGEVPQMNLGYIQGVLHSDPKSTTKWQQMLMDRGFLQQNHGANGSWDQDSQAALKSFYIAMAMPQALYAKDDQARTQASEFLRQFAGITASDVQNQNRDNPAFQDQVLQDWMLTQGPKDQKDSLNNYANQYGTENMPSAMRELANGGGFFQNLEDTLWTLPAGFASGVGAIAGWATGKGNVVGNWLDEHSPQHGFEQNVENQMTNSDKQLLAPALQDAKNSTGFLPFSWWDQKRNDVILNAAWFFGDAFGKGQVDNPFDPQGRLAKGVAAHDQDIIAAIAGDQWVKDHPEAAGITGFIVNTLDDPLTYFTGGAGKAVRLGLDVEKALRVAKGSDEVLQGVKTVREAASPAIRDAIDKWKDPRAYMQKATADQLVKAQASGDMHTARMVMGVNDINAGIIQPALDKFMAGESATQADALQLLNGFRYKYTGVHGLVNQRMMLSSLAPDVLQRVQSGNKFNRLRAIGAFAAEGNEIILSKPYEVADRMSQLMTLAGMSWEDISKELNKFYKAEPAGRRAYVYGDFEKVVDDAIQKNFKGKSLDGARRQQDGLARGRQFVRTSTLERKLGAHRRIQRTMFAPTPSGPIEKAAEMSHGKLTQKYVQQLQDEGDRAMEAVQNTFDDNIHMEVERLVKKTGMSVDDAENHYLASDEFKALQTQLNEHLDQIQKSTEISSERGAPMFSGQLQDKAHLPIDNYSLATYLHDHLAQGEELGARIRADAFLGVWKKLTLGRPSTMIRVMLGDDSIRSAFEIANMGHPIAGLKSLVTSSGKGLYAGLHLPGSKALVERAAAETEGLLAPADLMHAIGDADESHFVGHGPKDLGYDQSFKRMFHVMQNSPEVKAWAAAMRKGDVKGAKKAVVKALVNNDNGARELAQIRKVRYQTFADQLHDYMSQWARSHEVMKWLDEGNIDNTRLQHLIKNAPEVLPNVAAPRLTIYSKNAVLNAVRSGPDSLWDHIARPMITAARGEIMRNMKAQYERHIREQHPEWDNPANEEKVKRLATAEAYEWAKKSLYQGQRTVMGRAVRHVFPFQGATMNMTRFWLRQAKMRPQIIEPVLRAANAFEAAASGKQQDQTLAGQGVLGALGFAGSDILQGNLAHAFFFSSDGIASFIPSFGPVFSPLFSAADKNQGIHDLMSGIPGLREDAQYASGSNSRAVVPWMEQLASGALLATTGHPFTAPLVGGDEIAYQKAIAEKYKQLEADYLAGKRSAPPTQDEAARSVGLDQITGATLGAALPISPKVVDSRQQEINLAAQEMRSAETPQQMDSVIAAHPDITPFLKYIDTRVSPQEKDTIAADPKTSWVVPYATSIYESADPQATGSLAEFSDALKSGNEHVMGVQEMQTKVAKQQQYNDAWLQYQNLVVIPEQNYLVKNGVDKTDAGYKQWVHDNIAPEIENLGNQYPDWRAQFLSSSVNTSDPMALEQKAQPLASLMSWEVIPQMTSMENQKSVLWRNAILLRDSAASEIVSIHNQGGSQSDIDAVMNGLNERLTALGQQDPEFNKELQLYRWSTWKDLVLYEANQEQQYGVPQQQGGAQ